MNTVEYLNILKRRALRTTNVPIRPAAEFTPAARALARAAVLEVLG